MVWSTALDALENVLADLYRGEQESVRLADKAGLDPKQINFSGKSILNWHNILVEAERCNRTRILLGIAASEYAENKDLIGAFNAFQIGSEVINQGTPSQPGPELPSPGAKDISISRLPITGNKLFGRKKQLSALDRAWENDKINVVSIVAWGGVGKSALVNHRLRAMAQSRYRGAEGVYAWSFYRQGTSEHLVSADEFIESALIWFEDPDPSKGSAWEKGERLAKLVRKRRNLLLLDGLEPLQFPPGEHEGRLKDPAIQSLLRELAAFNPGLCVITSRLVVTDIANFQESTALLLSLEHLSPQAGAQILEAHGVKGTKTELKLAAQEYGGHCLALTLLGNYLSDAYQGDVRQRTKVQLEDDLRRGAQAHQVMAAYEKWFGDKPEVEVLRILGLFDRRADAKAVEALQAVPPINGLTDSLSRLNQAEWRRVLSGLRRAGLVADLDPFEPDSLDAHPLVREHFGRRLRRFSPEAWRQGNDRLFEHFRLSAKEFPETLQDMEPLFLAVRYGCSAGRHRDALHEVYLARIMQGEQGYAARRLGAYGTLLSVLAQFFENGDWSKPVNPNLPDCQGLEPDDQMTVLTQAGLCLMVTKGYASEEMQSCYVHLRKLCTQLGKTSLLYSVLLGQWRYSMVTSELTTTLQHAKAMLALAQEQNDAPLLSGAYSALATTAYFMGTFDLAQQYAKQGIKNWDPHHRPNAIEEYYTPIVTNLVIDAKVLWHSGKADQAEPSVDEAVNVARNFSDLNALTVALYGKAYISQFSRQRDRVLESSKELIEVCSAQGFELYLAVGRILKGWALAWDEAKEGLALIKQGLAQFRGLGASLNITYFLTLQAEALAHLGQTKDALFSLEEAECLANKLKEQWWLAELHRMKGELLVAENADISRINGCFEESISIARGQGSKSLELRAAMSLYRLAHQQGNDHEARQVVAGIFNQFTEGFETADLQEARFILS